MNIQEIRTSSPEFAGMSDADVIEVLRQVDFPDLSPEQIAQQIGVKLAPPPAPERGMLRTAGDYGVSLLKGAIAVPEAAVGLADIPTGGRVGKFLENEGGSVGFRPKEAKTMLSDLYSEKQKQAFRNVQEADGLGSTFVAALQNPSVIAHTVAESLPAMGAGGVVGRGLMAAAPQVSGVVAAGLGEGIVGAGSAAEQIRQETPDGLMTAKQSGLSALSGAGTAAFGILGGKVAKSLGFADVDNLLVGVKVNPANAHGVVRRVLQGAASEGLLEELPQSVQEQVLQNLALGKDIAEGVNQAAVLGLLSGAAMGGGANILSSGAGVESSPDPQAPPLNPAAPAAPIVPEVGPLSRAANVGAAAIDQTRLTPEEIRAFNNAYRRPVETPLADLQQSVRGQTEYTSGETVEAVNRATEDAWLSENVREGEQLAPGDDVINPSSLGQPATPEDMGESIARTDAKVRERRISSAIQNVLDGQPNSTAEGLVSIESSLKRVGLPPLTEGEKTRVMRSLGAEAAFSGKTEPSPLPKPRVTAKDPGADNKSLESQIPEKTAKTQPSLAPTPSQPQSAFPTYEAADAYRREQKRRGGTVHALPAPTPDGGFTMVGKDSPRYEEAKQLRAEHMAAKAKVDSGILDGDILNRLGAPFTIKGAAMRAAKKAGDGFTAVEVKGGFVARPGSATATEGAKNVEDTQPATTRTPKAAQAKATQAPAPETGDAAATQPLPAAGGVGDVQASGVEKGEAPSSARERTPIGGERRVGGEDPHVRSYSLRDDGILERKVDYPDGESKAQMLVTDKAGDETWVSSDQFNRGEYYPLQMTPEAASKAADDDTPQSAPAKEVAPQVKEVPSATASDSDSAVASQPSADEQRRAFHEAERRRQAPGNRARSQAAQANPLRAFLAKHGVAVDLRAEFAPGRAEQRAAMVPGYGPIFRKSGKQLDALAQAAVEEGFLTTPDAAALHSLIDKAVRGHRVIAQFAAGSVENEMEARIARQREIEEDTALSMLDQTDDALAFDLVDADIPWEAEASSATTEQFLRAMGASEQEIQDAIAQESRTTQESDRGRGGAEQGAARAQEGGDGRALDPARLGSARANEGGQPGTVEESQRDLYTRDLFGGAVDWSSRPGSGEQTVPGNARSAPAVPGDTPAPAGEYRARTIVGTQAERQLGISRISSLADLATATQYLYRSAVERLDGIVTDADGKPLAVVGGFKGAVTQASVYPSTIVGEAVRIPGAARIWFSHNHPSGNPSLSLADRSLEQTLREVFRGSGIEPMGLIAVGNGQFQGTNGESGAIAAPSAQVRVPAIERELEPDAKNDLGPGISSPADAIGMSTAYYKRSKGPGLILLNAELRVVAWVPLAPQMLGNLRGTGQLQAIYRAVSESNANAAILVHGGELDAPHSSSSTVSIGQNIGAALNNVDARPLDIINAKTGESAASNSLETARGPVFSRSSTTQTTYEGRIDALFAGDKPKLQGARVLDRSDMVAFLGLGDGPVNLAEGKVIAGQDNHQHMTAAVWKKIPEWLESPAMVFDSDTAENRLVFIAPELVNGSPVRIVIEPNAKGGGVNAHLLINAYDAQNNAFRRWANDGLLRYVDRNKYAPISGTFQPQLTGLPGDKRRGKILTDKQYSGWRRGNSPAQSRAEPVKALSIEQQADVDRVQSQVDVIKAKWQNSPEVVVASNMQDPKVPQRVREHDAHQKSQGATGEPEGFFYQGKVYIIASQTSTASDVARVLLHESLGHYGLRGVFGDALDGILTQLAGLRRAEIVAKAREYGLIPDQVGKSASVGEAWAAMSKEQRLQAAEEVLAEMAQTRPDIGYVRRAIAAIRGWLRNNIPQYRDLGVTDDEIIRQFILPARGWVERGAQSARAGELAMAFSRSADQTQTPEFKRWFGDSKVVDAEGKPLVVYHGTAAQQLNIFDLSRAGQNGRAEGAGIYFTTDRSIAEGYGQRGTVVEGYVSIKKPLDYNAKPFSALQLQKLLVEAAKIEAKENGHEWQDGYLANFTDTYSESLDASAREAARSMLHEESAIDQVGGLVGAGVDSQIVNDALTSALGYDGYRSQGFSGEGQRGGTIWVAMRSEQVKSATGNNGDFDPKNPDIRFSRSTPVGVAFGDAATLRDKAQQTINDLFQHDGTVSWWHKTVGTMHNLARRSPEFKRVFDGVQNFLNDVSAYATEAADLAPRLLPKLESWRDITKTPISAEDTKAISAPIFEGTLAWGRDTSGKATRIGDLEERFANMTVDAKKGMLLRHRRVAPEQVKGWQNLPPESFNGAVENRFREEFLKEGVVFTDDELRSLFSLTDQQISLYREFRASVDQSLNRMAITEMLRYGGDDVKDVREVALEAGTADEAAKFLADHLRALAKDEVGRADLLNDTAARIEDKAQNIGDLMERGYAPLSRFGHYTLDVLDEGGERAYFGMFESKGEANRMARKMRENYPKGKLTQGTVSEQAYKLFAGMTPETLELFGEMVGLEQSGSEAQDQMFQEYLKLAKANRSAMKRLIHRKGISGFSEDAGRVLAGFIYSNARLAATNLHTSEISHAVADIPKQQGELKDMAQKLTDYIRNPQEEAQAIRGLMFAQYLGGSLASAFVNMTQPIAVTMPYLSQWGGVRKASARMKGALTDVMKKSTGDARLDAALRKAEAEGIVAPQEVHQLMAQARGRSSLKAGDGTTKGDLAAKASNIHAKVMMVWGKPFSAAEMFNRRVTFIAAWRTAVAEGIADPAAFAAETINETQFVYNKGNRPQWARGAIGATLFTFKSYSISYIELLHRLATQGGPEGKKAALFMVAMMFLMSGAGGLPFMSDTEDALDGLMQRLGYSFSSKQARKQWLIDTLGKDAAEFVESGISGLPGAPLDVSGRLGLGNLIPGTGLLTKRQSFGREVSEIAGPAGDFVKRVLTGVDKAAGGDFVGGATEAMPTAVRNAKKGWDMYATGMYKDSRGRKVVDSDGYEALIKAAGFQPRAVAEVQEGTSTQQYLIGQNRIMKARLGEQMANAVFERDPGKQQDVRDSLNVWNQRNPSSPIKLDMSGVRRRVTEMRRSKAERVERAAPKAIRAQVREALVE